MPNRAPKDHGAEADRGERRLVWRALRWPGRAWQTAPCLKEEPESRMNGAQRAGREQPKQKGREAPPVRRGRPARPGWRP